MLNVCQCNTAVSFRAFVLKAFSESCPEIQLYNIYYTGRCGLYTYVFYIHIYIYMYIIQLRCSAKVFGLQQYTERGTFGVKSTTTMKRGRNIYNTVRNNDYIEWRFFKKKKNPENDENDVDVRKANKRPHKHMS